MTVTRNILMTRIVVGANEMVIVRRDGLFTHVLTKGALTLFNGRHAPQIDEFTLIEGGARGDLLKAIFRDAPALAEDAMVMVETSPAEVAIVRRKGKIVGVVGASDALIFNRVMGEIAIERIDTSETVKIAPKLAIEIARAAPAMLTRAVVAHGHAGLVFMDGELSETVGPGTHAFLNVGRTITVKTVDLRRMSLEVTGQELMTSDRVSIRVNLSADYRVVDAKMAVTSVRDFSDALYKAVGSAFRSVLSNRTLDEVLAAKGQLDAEAAEKVRAVMAETGVEIGEVMLKDVILPGEMRDILNTVVAAEKEAEANVIRRREETQATRALLNTAKVMADNPVMLRLKELEALETVAGKVERITVHNGTRGLLDDIVSLKGET